MPELQQSSPTNLQNWIKELVSLVNDARSAHYRLVWVVCDSSIGRSTFMRAFSESLGCPLLDVGQALSQALLDVPASLRASSVEECFSDFLDAAGVTPVCLDRLEILFEPSLKLYPSELVKGASRYRTMIAAWPGTMEDNSFVFGPEGHPAHRRVPCEQMECTYLEIHP